MCISCFFFFLIIRRPPRSTRTVTLFPYTTRFRSSSNRSVRSSTGLVVVMAGARLSTWFEDQGTLLPSARACRLQRREPAAGHERGQEARRQQLHQLQPEIGRAHV